MKVIDIFERVITLLGYSNADGAHTGLEVLKGRTVCCTNQILSDLGLPLILSSLEDAFEISPLGVDAIVYGVAMLLALGVGDGEKNVLFGGLYNIKRTAYKSAVTEKNDVLPCDDGGV